jgi:hypothetical protein
MDRLARLAGRASVSLPCIHHPRLEDNPLNRTLLAGLVLGKTAAHEPQIRASCALLAAQLSLDVSWCPLSDVLLAHETSCGTAEGRRFSRGESSLPPNRGTRATILPR